MYKPLYLKIENLNILFEQNQISWLEYNVQTAIFLMLVVSKICMYIY